MSLLQLPNHDINKIFIMGKMHISDIQTMPDVIRYWHECLEDTSNVASDAVVAGWMGGVIHPDVYDKFEHGKNDGHPAFEIITELALSLEVPSADLKWRGYQWDCVRGLLSVLDAAYMLPLDADR
jgi:hypothetical protein